VKERLATELVGKPPSSIGSHAVRAVPLTTNDGVKFFTTDGSWLLVRFSGTEPLVRVYAEATSAELRDDLLHLGENLARG
jgi:phosphomannomutase